MIISLCSLLLIGSLTLGSEDMARVPDQQIWDFFYELFGHNEYATAGACGNMMHESACRTDNAEDRWNDNFHHSDSWLTERINNCITQTDPYITLDTFLQRAWYVNNVGFGYGLSQWTTSTRRTELWNRTIAQGIPIDDVNAQLQYIKDEFNGNATSGNWSDVKTAMMQCTTVDQAVEVYRNQYEGGGYSESRFTYAHDFYNRFAGQGSGYPITFDISGNGYAEASVNTRIQNYADAGDYVVIDATANGDDTFLLWAVTSPSSLQLDFPVTSNPNAFTMPSQAVQIHAEFTGETPTPQPPPQPPPWIEPLPTKRKHMPIWMYPMFRV